MLSKVVSDIYHLKAEAKEAYEEYVALLDAKDKAYMKYADLLVKLQDEKDKLV